MTSRATLPRACALLVGGAFASCTCGNAPDCVEVLGGPAGEVGVKARTVVDGLTVPWSIGFLPTGEWLVTERGGALRVVRDDVLAPDPIAEVPIDARGEAGLLGIAIDPSFATTRAVFLYATFGDENRVERWLVNDDVTAAVKERTILAAIPAGSVHDGGRLRFAPDGTLFVSTGETGERALSRDATSLGGKILRIEKDGDVPDDNPDPASPVYVQGIRNSQGFDFRDGIAELVIADHGPSGELARTGHDELNVARAGDDLGWPDIWACEARDGLVSPRMTWTTALPPGGIVIARGDAVPAWKGDVLVAALGARQLQRVTLPNDGLATNEIYFDGELGRLRDIVEAPDGRLLVTTSNCDGRGTCPDRGDRIVSIEAD